MSRVGDWLSLALTVAFFGAIFLLAWLNRKSRRRAREIPDDPAQPYTAFTREFDLQLRGTELRQKLIGASIDHQRGWFELSREHWKREVDATTEIYEAQRTKFEALMMSDGPALQDLAVSILVDQSGSMKGERMRYAAACARMLIEALGAQQVKTELLGFSTAGWQGGLARQKWIADGRPERPGRACALLHIIYKAFDEPSLNADSWQAMLDPNVLRENIDGEAIEWAARRLRASGAKHQHLLVISDGAPVDDATATYNGPTYLIRHLLEVIDELRTVAHVSLTALEIGQEGVYPREIATLVPEPDNLPDASVAWLLDLPKKSPRMQ